MFYLTDEHPTLTLHGQTKDSRRGPSKHWAIVLKRSHLGGERCVEWQVELDGVHFADWKQARKSTTYRQLHAWASRATADIFDWLHSDGRCTEESGLSTYLRIGDMQPRPACRM